MTRRLIGVLVALAGSAAARADVAPPPGTKRVPVTTVVEAAEEFPDVVFLASSSSTDFEPPSPDGKAGGWQVRHSVSAVSLRPGQPARNTGGRRSGSILYAIPKAAADKTPDRDQLLKDVAAGKVPGAAHVAFGSVAELPAADRRAELTVRYRVERTAGGVQFTRLDRTDAPAAAGEPEGPSSVPAPLSGSSSWRWIVAGAAAAAALILGGLWAEGRVRRRA